METELLNETASHNEIAEADQTQEKAAPVYEDVRRALLANRANTLALLACLRETLEERPFREAEAAVADSEAMGLTMQGPHALYGILIKCGAVESIEVPEDEAACPAGDEVEVAVLAGGADSTELPDQPVDYLLRTTDLGHRALEEFEPTKRFAELIAGEPALYRSAYDAVLALCERGASKSAIETALAGHEALLNPKQIYPGYFISKLETVGGISWSGAWRTTEAGRRMRALLA
ncbi:hypothetical protein [Adlercreutzia shanghongiae]|uniref:Uncharacterized protein n=1 Tax=Adlercreutzia shanghongiae TaxID=3111773 RepID=A0ABU6J1W1_9ACTN|nr:hypothetical protein [Adlercreutzia sp. R22]MEC4295880.1 hypothetical protein [Adlercreutzia sp. R22]